MSISRVNNRGGECPTLYRVSNKVILSKSKGFHQMCKKFTLAEQGNVMISLIENTENYRVLQPFDPLILCWILSSPLLLILGLCIAYV